MSSVNGSAAGALNDVLKNQSSSTQVSASDPLFAGLKGDDLKRAMAQQALQKQQELVAFISNISKKINEIAMATIGNMR